MGPTRVLIEDPCPLGLQVMLTVALLQEAPCSCAWRETQRERAEEGRERERSIYLSVYTAVYIHRYVCIHR